MSKEITDDMLVRVATDSALKYSGRLGIEYKSSAFTGYMDAYRAALEVERESLVIAMELRKLSGRHGNLELENRADAHIQVLRTRLGITE